MKNWREDKELALSMLNVNIIRSGVHTRRYIPHTLVLEMFLEIVSDKSLNKIKELLHLNEV